MEAGRTVARVLLEAGHRDGIGFIGAAPTKPSPRGQPRRDSTTPGNHRDAQRARRWDSGCRSLLPQWQPEIGDHVTHGCSKDTPSGLICFNDRLALGAYQALADAGLDVPWGRSVVSFDDDLMAIWVRPRLTTVALPHYELERVAINILLDQESKSGPNGEPTIRRIPMPLRARDSVELCSTQDPGRRAAKKELGPRTEYASAGGKRSRRRGLGDSCRSFLRHSGYRLNDKARLVDRRCSRMHSDRVRAALRSGRPLARNKRLE